MRGHPSLVDLRHPVVDLVEGVVGITRTRPVAEGLRGGDARLARVDPQRVVGLQPAQVEQVRLHPRARQYLLAELRKAERLRHLAGAGPVVARGAADHQHARGRRRILLARLRGEEPVARLPPFVAQRMGGIGEARAGGRGARRLAVVRIGLPRDRFQPVDGLALALEGRIEEVAQETLAEFRARHRPGRRLSGSDLRHAGGSGGKVPVRPPGAAQVSPRRVRGAAAGSRRPCKPTAGTGTSSTSR